MRKTSRTGVTQRRHATPSRFRVTSPCYVVWCYVFLGGVVAGGCGTRLKPPATLPAPPPAHQEPGNQPPHHTRGGGPRAHRPPPPAHVFSAPPAGPPPPSDQP